MYIAMLPIQGCTRAVGLGLFQSEERAQWAAALAQERLREKRPDVDEGALLLAHEAAVAAAKQANVRRRSRSQRHDDYIAQRVVPLPKSGALTPPSEVFGTRAEAHLMASYLMSTRCDGGAAGDDEDGDEDGDDGGGEEADLLAAARRRLWPSAELAESVLRARRAEIAPPPRAHLER